jgi:CHAT domain-containing protein
VKPMTTVFDGRLDLARAPFDVAGARRLYDALLRPLESQLATARRLVIAPDARLHSVPFDALVTSSNGSPRFVLDRWSIQYTTAAVAQRDSRAVAPPPRTMLLVVGDAPGSDAERDLVREGWGADGDIRVLEGARATEAGVRQSASQSILHIAAHARSDERDPLASYLALQPDSTDDGLLHYVEIENARLQYALVVLNACQTSAGELLSGSGFMSLARAFLIGGSSAVVATQWPVGATSGMLAAHFYQEVRSGAPLEEALRRAKLATRRNPDSAHPFYWASHVLLQRL